MGLNNGYPWESFVSKRSHPLPLECQEEICQIMNFLNILGRNIGDTARRSLEALKTVLVLKF